jgi:hypothetical protein
MNSEDKIHSKIKNASQNGEKDFPGMDKVWNRVEEKLDNTIVVQKKNTWQKLAIAATVLLSFSIIYQFVGNEETIKGKIKIYDTNPVIVSNDSVKKIMDKAKEVVVDNDNSIKKEKQISPESKFDPTTIESNPWATSFASTASVISDSSVKIKYDFNTLPFEEKNIITTELNKNNSIENEVSFRNSSLNSSSSNNSYLSQGKKFEAPTNKVKSNYKASKTKPVVIPKQNKDLVVIDGVAMDKNYNADKELNKISAEEIADTTYLPNPLYIINGIEYSEESLFGKNPTSPYAPLDKQRITSTSILKPADATKIYGKKGENGIVIITTKDGKPAEK